MSFKDYSRTPASNTSIGDGIYVGPNMERAKVRPSLQQIAADGREAWDEITRQTEAVRSDLAETFGAATYTLRDPCRVATTANITLSGAQTIDSVAVVAGDRVLVKNQTTGSENGIYVAAAGSWTRATDFDQAAEVVQGAYTVATEGASTVGAWVLVTDNPIVVGVTAQTWRLYRLDLVRGAHVYIDPTGAYADRNALLTLNREVTVPGGASANVAPSSYILTRVTGDNTSFKGASGLYINTGDKAGITSGQRGVLYGLNIDIVPSFDRTNSPADDATGICIANQGTGTGTEAVYIGRGTNALTRDFYASFGSDAWGTVGMYLNGHYDYGIDMATPSHHSTLAVGCLRGPPDKWLLSVANAADTIQRPVLATTSDGQVTLLDGKMVRQSLTWAPTITADSGSFTAASATWARWSIMNTRVFVDICVHITTKGSAAGALRFTLPYAPLTTDSQTPPAHGIRTDTGVALVGLYTGGVMRVTYATGVDPLANGADLVLSFSYEVAI